MRGRMIASQPSQDAGRWINWIGSIPRANQQGLLVVGRCGCAMCPTVFFQPYTSGNNELEVSQLIGRDFRDELVCAVLIQDDGVLSQLEFNSLDGHQSFGLPISNLLEYSQ